MDIKYRISSKIKYGTIMKNLNLNKLFKNKI